MRQFCYKKGQEVIVHFREFVVKHWPRLWRLVLVLVSVLLVAVTVVDLNHGVGPLAHFNLAYENNFAVWWSAVLLLLAALHAFDGWRLWRAEQPRAAGGWIALSLALAMLSADEVASFHERVQLLLPWSDLVDLLPFVLALGGLVGYAVVALWTAPGQRRSVLFILLALALFGLTVVQEMIEVSQTWQRVVTPGVRAGLEEGTELAAALLLIRAALPNTRGIFAPGRGRETPVFDVVLVWRGGLVGLSLIAAPVLAALTAAWAGDGRGHPAGWLAMALFLLVALAALRPFFHTGEAVGAGAWIAAGVAVVASAVSIGLDAARPYALLAAALMLTAGWLLMPGQPRGLVLAAGALIAMSAAVPLLVPSGFVHALSPTVAALIAFVVGTRPGLQAAPVPGWRQESAD